MANTTKKAKVGSVTIATVKSPGEARRITTQLEGAGIECSLMDERGAAVGGLGQPRLGGIKIQVDRGEVRRAIQLLNAKANSDEAVLSGSASRFRITIDGWKLIAIEVAAVVAFAALLARFFFY